MSTDESMIFGKGIHLSIWYVFYIFPPLFQLFLTRILELVKCTSLPILSVIIPIYFYDSRPHDSPLTHLKYRPWDPRYPPSSHGTLTRSSSIQDIPVTAGIRPCPRKRDPRTLCWSSGFRYHEHLSGDHGWVEATAEREDKQEISTYFHDMRIARKYYGAGGYPM